nr:hypothetical protein [Tanacetum cinerariifolium]
LAELKESVFGSRRSSVDFCISGLVKSVGQCFASGGVEAFVACFAEAAAGAADEVLTENGRHLLLLRGSGVPPLDEASPKVRLHGSRTLRGDLEKSEAPGKNNPFDQAFGSSVLMYSGTLASARRRACSMLIPGRCGSGSSFCGCPVVNARSIASTMRTSRQPSSPSGSGSRFCRMQSEKYWVSPPNWSTTGWALFGEAQCHVYRVERIDFTPRGLDPDGVDFQRFSGEQVAHGVDGIWAHVGHRACAKTALHAVVGGIGGLREGGGEQAWVAYIAGTHAVDHFDGARLEVQAVSNHELGPGALGRLGDGQAVFFIGGHGFFEQHVDACFECRYCEFAMAEVGRRQVDGVDFAGFQEGVKFVVVVAFEVVQCRQLVGFDWVAGDEGGHDGVVGWLGGGNGVCLEADCFAFGELLDKAPPSVSKSSQGLVLLVGPSFVGVPSLRSCSASGLLDARGVCGTGFSREGVARSAFPLTDQSSSSS